MSTLCRILPLWFTLALFVSDTHAQDLFEAMPLPEGIAATGDTTEVRALTAWAQEHQQSHSEQSRQIAERALTLARNLDDLLGIAESSVILGDLSFTSAPYQAEIHYTAAYEGYEEIGDERGIVHSRLSLANVYSRRGESEQALTIYYEILDILESFGDTITHASALSSISIIHRRQGDQEDALRYSERAVAVAETLDDPTLLVPPLINLGSVLMDQRSYENAESVLRRALAISEEQGLRRHTAGVFNNLGYLFNEQRHYERALPLLLNAERLSSELQETGLLGAVYEELGKAYLGLSEYDSALQYAYESLALAQDIGSVFYQMGAHRTLSRIYEATGNTGQALAHYQYYATARDSVFNVERAEIIAEMQTRYEMEERQRAIERLEQQNQIQTLRAGRRQTLLLFGIVVAMLVAGLFYYRYRTKQKANRLLEELDTAKSRFFANISHEFRTPLTVILGGLQDALAGRLGESSTKITEQHHVMLRNTRQLQRLIDEVLDLNRLESGRLELQPAPGDVALFLKRIVEAHTPLAERNGINLTLACDIERCPRLYDEVKLEKIVGNLLSNALKFTSQGGMVRVTMQGKKDVEISIADNGPGIPPEGQQKIFDRFSQLDHGVLKGGTGIGLALAKELVELHGGTITLESGLGDGSIFTIRLPLERVDLPTAQEEKAIRLPKTAEFETGGDGHTEAPLYLWDKGSVDEGDHTTILIIEDNEDVRAYIRRSLEETYRILEAPNGEEGLRQARSELPDLIVSDVMLPDIDGYEIARQLKAAADTECIPVVMLTARAAESDHVVGYGSGAETYLTKPFSPETLRAAIARLLEERRRLRRQLREETAKDAGNGRVTLHDRIRVVVFEHLHDEEFSVETLASTLNMSRHTLYRHVKEETGLSPSDFVRALRLERAYELLENGAGSVSEVAYAIGFKSLSHFTRSFREQYGRSPSGVLHARKD